MTQALLKLGDERAYPHPAWYAPINVQTRW